jgi:hypothetical protein
MTLTFAPDSNIDMNALALDAQADAAARWVAEAKYRVGSCRHADLGNARRELAEAERLFTVSRRAYWRG